MAAISSYQRPGTLAQALDLLGSGDWQIAAGCTDLFPATERKMLAGQVLDITGIPDLRGVTRDTDGIRIGATTTWTDIIRADLPAAFDGLKLAAREVGAMQIQNRGTIAGNLCNASPAADGLPPLLTLDAEVELATAGGTRRLPLQRFVLGPRRTARAPGEMVIAVHVPARSLQGQSHFLKLGARDYLVISIAMTAARLVIDDNRVTDAALAVGSCGPVATRLAEIEIQMIGHPLDISMITDEAVARAIDPIDDMRANAAYRAASAAELMRRTLKAFVSRGEIAA